MGMKTKLDLALVILKNASEEARELLEHAEGVAAFILENFPDEVPEHFVNSQCKSTETGLLGGYRKPEETGRMMLDSCRYLLRREREGHED